VWDKKPVACMANARSRQLAYFKDNVQTQDDHDDFDASQYYYNRDDQMMPNPGTSSGVVLGTNTNATRTEPGAMSALYHTNPSQFSSSVSSMHGTLYKSTPSGIGTLQQQVTPLTAGFAAAPHLGASSSTPYLPWVNLYIRIKSHMPSWLGMHHPVIFSQCFQRVRPSILHQRPQALKFAMQMMQLFIPCESGWLGRHPPIIVGVHLRCRIFQL
jgi:hypothetical protein